MASPYFGKVMLGLAEAVPYRRSTRLPLAQPVTLSGQDEQGRPLKEKTRTIDVGKQGARIGMLRAPLLQARIGIRTGGVDKAHSARVVWRGSRKRPDGLTDIGVEFLPPFDAETAWGVAPPDDWRAGPLALTPTQKLEYFAARDLEVAARPPQPSLGDELELPPLPRPANARPEGGDIPEDIRKEDNNTDFPIEGRGGDQPSAADLEGRSAPAGPHSRPTPAAHAEKLTASALAELMTRVVHTLDERADALADDQEKALASVQSAAREAAARLEAMRKQTEEGLEAAVAEHRKQLAGQSSGSAEELRRTSQEMLEKFRGEAAKAVLPADQGVDQETLKQELVGLAVSLRTEFSRLLGEQERKYAAGLSQVEKLARESLAKKTRETPAADSRAARWALMGVLGIVASAAIALLIFVYLSTRTVLLLPSNPPAEFLAPDPSWSANRKAAELELARAYWDLAIRKLQPAYGMAAALPEQPPPEFRIDSETSPESLSKTNLEADRQHYWQKLRAIWGNPEIRVQIYEWNPSWLGARLQPWGEMLRKLFP